MTERKTISPTLRGFETPASRLTAELQKLKIKSEGIVGALDGAAMDELAKALRAASALQAFPDPIILVDVKLGKVLMLNNASLERFPEIRPKGLEHPALSGWKEAAQELTAGRNATLPDYSAIGRNFERRASLLDGVLQVCFREKRDGPQIFYPFPVIDYSIALGFSSFRNEAAKKAFPIMENSPILAGIREAAPLMRNGTLKGISDVVKSGNRVFRRSAVYIAQSDVIRIFAADITGSASTSRASLSALCAFVEKTGAGGWNANSVAELARQTQGLLDAVKAEKMDLGRLELDFMRLTFILRRMSASPPPPQHEFESFRSVVADFFSHIKSE
ncbi:MAG TPA: hypothetical protein VLD37_04070 [Candidatus Bilamarchaeum sp.]|nr:hypothetical protein [Candidatus Bilamarchaeum sp.]